jgi:hypothetical protein
MDALAMTAMPQAGIEAFSLPGTAVGMAMPPHVPIMLASRDAIRESVSRGVASLLFTRKGVG